MFLHFRETSAIIAPTLAKELTMKTTQKTSPKLAGGTISRDNLRKLVEKNYDEERADIVRQHEKRRSKGDSSTSKAFADLDKSLENALKDSRLITKYKTAAPNARSFMTDRSTSADATKKSGGGQGQAKRAGYKNGGCVMAGRGSKYKGMK